MKMEFHTTAATQSAVAKTEKRSKNKNANARVTLKNKSFQDIYDNKNQTIAT